MAGYDRVRLKLELRRDEGFRARRYRDTVGKWTIGIGRNLDDVGIRPEETAALGITAASVVRDGVTEAQALALLEYDISVCERALDRRLPWWRRLDGVRQRVLVNMCFNLGIVKLLGFKATLRKIEAGDYAGAGANMLLSKWARQVGDRAKRLSAMMRTGKA